MFRDPPEAEDCNGSNSTGVEPVGGGNDTGRTETITEETTTAKRTPDAANDTGETETRTGETAQRKELLTQQMIPEKLKQERRNRHSERNSRRSTKNGPKRSNPRH